MFVVLLCLLLVGVAAKEDEGFIRKKVLLVTGKNEQLCAAYSSTKPITANMRYVVDRLSKPFEDVNACSTDAANASVTKICAFEMVDFQLFRRSHLAVNGNALVISNSSMAINLNISQGGDNVIVFARPASPFDSFYLRSFESHNDYGVYIFIILFSTILVGLCSYFAASENLSLFITEVEKQRQEERAQIAGTMTSRDLAKAKCYAGWYYTILLCAVIGQLLLLYYFYSYYVYVVQIQFIILTTISLHCHLWILASKVIHVDRGPFIEFTQKLGCGRINVISMIVFFCSSALPITWWLFRFNAFSFILQDLCGIIVCAYITRKAYATSFRGIFVVLWIFFIYDVFFVYVTPFFTSNGSSIMEEIVYGGLKRDELPPSYISLPNPISPLIDVPDYEQLPLLFRFPPMNAVPCYTVMAGIGFGDILFPAFYLAVLKNFDLFLQKENGGGGRKCGGSASWFFMFGLTMYLASLFLCFVALILSSSGQPALFFIVPLLSLSSFLQAAITKQCHNLWYFTYSSSVFMATCEHREVPQDDEVDEYSE